jgi:hypothetical protein
MNWTCLHQGQGRMTGSGREMQALSFSTCARTQKACKLRTDCLPNMSEASLRSRKKS